MSDLTWMFFYIVRIRLAPARMRVDFNGCFWLASLLVQICYARRIYAGRECTHSTSNWPGLYFSCLSLYAWTQVSISLKVFIPTSTLSLCVFLPNDISSCSSSEISVMTNDSFKLPLNHFILLSCRQTRSDNLPYSNYIGKRLSGRHA